MGQILDTSLPDTSGLSSDLTGLDTSALTSSPATPAGGGVDLSGTLSALGADAAQVGVAYIQSQTAANNAQLAAQAQVLAARANMAAANTAAVSSSISSTGLIVAAAGAAAIFLAMEHAHHPAHH